MMFRFGSRALRVAIVFAVAVGGAGCGASNGAADADFRAGLPLWEGRARDVFDDSIEPAAVGLSLEASSPRSDPALRERAQTADIVARVRVQTVTVESSGAETRYHLGVQVGVPPLRRPRLPDTTLDLVIRPESPAHGVAKAFDTRLSGRTFIAFVSRFAGRDGEPVFHFHLSADTPEVAAAVHDAVALGELEGT